jgi:hypothetical protein
MSLDYPFYEELCRLKHPGARWWRLGDSLYYLGLLLAVVALAASPIALVSGLLGRGWRHLLISAIVFAVGAVVFLIGSSLKGYAYRLADRDGISSEEVHRRGAPGVTDTPDVAG